ncbi:MAG: ATP-dependent Clp protease proteolytic subunit, partial [Verrucomicrobiota bacterium]
SVSDEVDWQLANDLLADSANSEQDEALDEKLLESRKIVITTDVNPHLSKQLIASLILLNKQDPDKPIDLYLRTEGGWISDAFAVVDTMNATSAPVNVYALGGTHSAGAIILAGATGRRVAFEHSVIMIHDNLSKPGQEEYNSDLVDNQRIISFYRKHAKLPEDWFQGYGDKVYYLNSKQALRYGIIDEIGEKF